MKVEVIEKGDNEVTVKFTGLSPMDATLLGMVKLGPCEGEASLSSQSGYSNKDKLMMGSFYVEAIDVMQRPREGK